MSSSKSTKKVGFLRDWGTFFILLLCIILFRIFLFEPFHIPSGSMRPNLVVGDYVVVAKYPYGFSNYSFPFWPDLFEGRVMGSNPERGDVVIFVQNNRRFVKRLIGLPGDHVQVRDGIIYINGAPVRRKRLAVSSDWGAYDINLEQFRETLPDGRSYTILDSASISLDNTQEFVVPEEYYFVMGDNRDNSVDSRVKVSAGGVGLIPEEKLVGRAEFVILSSEGDVPFWQLGSWLANLRPDRFFVWVE